MSIIRLLDARRGLYRKCEELFGNEKIAEAIYRFLCDGIEECEDVAHEREHGEWREKQVIHKDEAKDIIEEWQSCRCSFCKRYDTRPYMYYFDKPNFCSWCGADMRKETNDERNY